MRKERLCSPYPLDYSEVDNMNWQAWISTYRDDEGDMQLKKQAFTSWPAPS